MTAPNEGLRDDQERTEAQDRNKPQVRPENKDIPEKGNDAKWKPGQKPEDKSTEEAA